MEVSFEDSPNESRIVDQFNSKTFEEINWEEVERVMPFYTSQFKFMKKNSIKIFPIDKNIDAEDDLVWLNKRDVFMSKSIKELKESGTCKKTFYPVGASHILSSTRKQRVNLSQK